MKKDEKEKGKMGTRERKIGATNSKHTFKLNLTTTVKKTLDRKHWHKIPCFVYSFPYEQV